jgi:hypothetical protein
MTSNRSEKSNIDPSLLGWFPFLAGPGEKDAESFRTEYYAVCIRRLQTFLEESDAIW